MTGAVKLNTAGGGSVVVQPASSIASDVTVNVPSQNCTLGIQGPAFSAYRGSAQNITASTVTKIQYNTEVFDPNSNYDSTTNYRFTPTVAGYYQVNAYLSVSGAFSGANGYTNLYIYKNGSQVAVGGSQPSNNNYSMMSVSSLFYCNGTTDYIEVYHAASVDTAVVAGIAWNGFSVSMVRSA